MPEADRVCARFYTDRLTSEYRAAIFLGRVEKLLKPVGGLAVDIVSDGRFWFVVAVLLMILR